MQCSNVTIYNIYICNNLQNQFKILKIVIVIETLILSTNLLVHKCLFIRMCKSGYFISGFDSHRPPFSH